MVSANFHYNPRSITSCCHLDCFYLISILIIESLNSRAIDTDDYFTRVLMTMYRGFRSWLKNIKHTLTVFILRITKVESLP